MMKKKMTQEQQNLVIGNYRLMEKFIENRGETDPIPAHLRDDFISDMAWHFCNSAIKFDKSKGFKFSTYAYGGFHMCCSNIKSRKYTSYQKNNFLTQKEVSGIIESVSTVNEKHIGEESLSDLINHASLTKKENTILQRYYFDEEPMRVIGVEYNVSRARISQVIQQIVKKLQRVVGVEHLIIEDFYEI